MNGFDQYNQHTTHVDTIRSAGATVPLEWDQIRARFEQLDTDTGSYLDRLTAAVINPGTGKQQPDLETLHALALAQSSASNSAIADVINSVRREVAPALVRAYRPVAMENYRLIAQQFDDLAGQFHAAAAVVDPETPPENLVTADEHQRLAWSQAQFLAAELDDAVTVLASGAVLAELNAHTTDDLLPLSVDTAGHHRRRVWEAWETAGTRTGRWGALTALGVTIRAVHPDRFARYRRPQPIEIRHVPAGNGMVNSYRPVEIDPEDLSAAHAV